MNEEKTGPLGPQHDEAAWLEARRHGIGASEVAAILGVHPFLDEIDVYNSKVHGIEQDQTPFMERGRILEEPAANLYARETGRTLRRMPLQFHKELPQLFATLDRQILSGADSPTAGLELKVPAWGTFAKVKAEGLLPYWIVQGQVQHMVTGYPFIGFGILNADAWKMLTADYQPAPELSDQILTKVDKWWQEHIIGATPPAPKIQDAEVELPPVATDQQIVTRDDPEWLDAMSMLADAKSVLDQAKELDKLARARAKELMRDAGQSVVEGGGVRAYLKTQAGRSSFQKKELAASSPVDRGILVELLQVEYGIALTIAEEIAGKAALDLSTFDKKGRPFEVFKPYFLKGDR